MSEVIDNKANRIRVLKDIIKHLHAGNPPGRQGSFGVHRQKWK